MNDPDFVPDMQLPRFDLDALVANSQATNQTSSQMSPYGSALFSGSRSPGRAISIPLNLQDSDSPGSHGYPFGPDVPSSAQKTEDRYIIAPDDGPGDWGFDIDENGNIVELAKPAIVQDEPDLPAMPMEGVIQEVVNPPEQDQPIVDDQGDVIMMDQSRPEAEFIPRQDDPDAFQDDQPRQAPARRRKRKARTLLADEETQVSRRTMKDWGENYLTNCGVKKVRPTTAGQAKANAMLLTFGFGIGNIGQNLAAPGMIHPLALAFSGDALFTAFTGLDVPELPRGTRRSASEAIEDDDGEGGRRVKQRLDDEVGQQGRGALDDDIFSGMLIEDAGIHSSPEVGREAQAPMSDHLSSALRQPWNRGSSLLPGSSIRGSAQKRQGHLPSSPLAKHGGNIQDVHFSDGPSLGDDFSIAGLPLEDDPFGRPQVTEGKDDKPDPGGWPALDIQGQNFLSYMEDTVRENGERRQDDDFDVNRKWVAFDDVFVPEETPRDTAAQAFYHTLCLATKGSLEVQQDGAPDEPFGAIWVGARLVADGGVGGAGIL